MNESAEITIKELSDMAVGSYLLADVRDEISFGYGAIPGAVSMPNIVELAKEGTLAKDKKYILYCMKGVASADAAIELRELDYDAVSLAGGYSAWLMASFGGDDKQEDIEKSLRKGRFHKALFSKFAKAINTYDLIQPGDKIAVCISGGKDSMLMAKLFQELKRHNKFPFELVFLVMDPGYSEVNRKLIENNARIMGVPITVFESQIFEAVYDIKKSPCYLCARMRRGHLYNKAKELGCNKIALGHHYDDVIETILMGMLYGAQVQTMMPKLHSSNFEGMELIRPMYCIHEDDIIRWKNAHELEFIQCACRFTENCTMCDNGGGGSKRQEVKQLLKRLKKDNPDIEKSIFNSIHSVCLDTMPGWKTKGEEHSFLENYDKK